MEKEKEEEILYWLVLDPCKNMICDPDVLASQITGIFLCREDAEAHLKDHEHVFSDRAIVYCLSGFWSKNNKQPYLKIRG